MKKVISAMTAAVMTASAFASVISASAVYSKPEDVGFYLKALPGDGYTVSEDGKTVTFASAADAAGKKVDIQHFIVADTKDPSIQQYTYMVASNNESMVHSPSTIVPLNSPAYDAPREYTVNGETFTTDMFVTPFGYLDILGDYNNDTGSYVESNTSAFLWDDPEIKNDALIVGWMYGAQNTEYENYQKTAAFMTEKSDELPTSQFAFTMDEKIVDGTYKIEFADGYMDYGQQIPDDSAEGFHYSFTNGNTVNGGPTPESEIIPGSLEGITIIVGNPEASEETTEPTTTEPTTTEPKPTEPTTTEPTTTEPGDEDKHDKGYEWSVADATFDPANPPKGNIVQMQVNVWNDPGTSGCTVMLTVDDKKFAGKTAEGFPFEVALLKKGAAYTQFTQFINNPDTAEFADATANSKGESDVAKQGAAAAIVAFKLKDGAELTPGTKYKIGFAEECNFSNATGEKLNPILTPGYLIIAGGEDTTEPTTTEPKPTDPTDPKPTDPTDPKPTDPTDPKPTDPTDPKPTDPTDPTPSKYIYGDVNKNGKVELVDIVMLNRYLTGYDNQDLDDYQVVVANCSRSGESDADTTKKNLNGQDSIEILKYLIGLVASLPNNAA